MMLPSYLNHVVLLLPWPDSASHVLHVISRVALYPTLYLSYLAFTYNPVHGCHGIIAVPMIHATPPRGPCTCNTQL
jgi:hypothetical protein